MAAPPTASPGIDPNRPPKPGGSAPGDAALAESKTAGRDETVLAPPAGGPGGPAAPAPNPDPGGSVAPPTAAGGTRSCGNWGPGRWGRSTWPGTPSCTGTSR